MSQRDSSEQGFTLIEMIVVVSIVGVLLAVSIPNLRDGRFREEVKATTRELAADIQYAQTLSISQKVSSVDEDKVVSVGVVFPRNAREYRIFEDINGNSVYDEGSDPVIKMTEYPNQVKLTEMLADSVSVFATEDMNVTFQRLSSGGGLIGRPICLQKSCNTELALTFSHDALPSYTKRVRLQPTGVTE